MGIDEKDLAERVAPGESVVHLFSAVPSHRCSRTILSGFAAGRRIRSRNVMRTEILPVYRGRVTCCHEAPTISTLTLLPWRYVLHRLLP